ncbi:phospholipid/cholesterol/gamma-HCH transport system substrate-binding protein [Rhizomicrobium palustre]|uniref:Phospholipid/cholesterol/gamma-HCH transport system substrate-binding protein n=1 Tax=Rhizomicrobium palustre TaxID=189966 RepID=A0A846MW53_9PROT|nr:MlaD family protein [Rhizomicrobium palustre]NIK87270.1 phospholipid/cholesterol/gamma-HCH transport system substrate-binding protein [Rhizomicrobium palustre]
METKANYVAVGAFVMACLVALVITVLWLAGFQYSHEYVYYRTYFHGPVTGLGKGTAVRYNGIDVGRVDNLQFDPNDPQIVVATLQVQPGLNIRTDSTTSIEPQGLTGGSYVEISGGTKNAALLQPPPGESVAEIKSSPSALQKLTQGAPELLAKLNNIADRLMAVVSDENQKHLTNTLASLDKTTSALAARSGDIDTTLANLAAASKELPGTIATANQSLKKVGKLADDADDFVKGDGLAELSGLIADTRRAVSSLNRLTDELDRQPTKLIFGDRRKGYTPQ